MGVEVFAAIIGIAVIGLIALLWFAARSAITVCVAEIRDGKLEVTHGGLAPRVLADLRDVVVRPRVERATLRVLRARGRAELETKGDLTAAQLQQLRNVIGSVPLAKLENARGTEVTTWCGPRALAAIEHPPPMAPRLARGFPFRPASCPRRRPASLVADARSAFAAPPPPDVHLTITALSPAASSPTGSLARAEATWRMRVENTGDVPLRILADARALTLDVTPLPVARDDSAGARQGAAPSTARCPRTCASATTTTTTASWWSRRGARSSRSSTRASSASALATRRRFVQPGAAIVARLGSAPGGATPPFAVEPIDGASDGPEARDLRRVDRHRDRRSGRAPVVGPPSPRRRRRRQGSPSRRARGSRTTASGGRSKCR